MIPGGVDPHCHWNLGWSETRSEGQEHSWAAAWGGTTTLIDFAFQEGEVSLHDAIAAKREEADGSMAVDYGLHAHPLRQHLVRGDGGDRRRHPRRHPDDQDADHLRLDVATTGTATASCAKWPSTAACDRACRGRRARALADEEVPARGQDARRLHLRDARLAGRGGSPIRRSLLLAERTGSPLYIFHMAAGAAWTRSRKRVRKACRCTARR